MINEFDINDWEQLPVAPLYSVQRQSPILLEDSILLFFDHIDGMYSVCHPIVENVVQSSVVHLAAFANVTPYARIDKQKKAS